MTPATTPRPLPNESTNPLPALGPLTPPISHNPPPATAPGRQPYPSWVTGPDDTCPIPLTQPPATPATPPANKPRRNWPWVIGGILLLPYLIGLIGLVGIIGGGDKSSTSTVTTAQPPAPAAPAAAPTPLVDLATTFGDGTYIVGTNIGPGTYETTGPAAGEVGMCFWARLKDTSGNLDSIIASEAQRGPATVTISQTDGAFTTAGCNRWQELGSLDLRPATG